MTIKRPNEPYDSDQRLTGVGRAFSGKRLIPAYMGLHIQRQKLNKYPIASYRIMSNYVILNSMSRKNKKRTDAHRPSVLIPEDYEFFGCSPRWTYVGDNMHGEREYHDFNEFGLTDEQQDYVDNNRFNGNAINKGGCDCCGSRPTAVAYYKHIPTGEVITVGLTCSEKIQAGAWEEGHRQALSVIAGRKRAIKKAEGESFIDSNSGLRSVLESGKHEILDDMLKKAHKYGSLSEKQIAFAYKLFAQCVEREEEHARRLEALEGSTLDCSQRITVTGKVIKTKWQDSDYGGSMKMLVELDSGFKVWGTIPTLNVDATDYYNQNWQNLTRYTDASDENKTQWQKNMDKFAKDSVNVDDTIQFTAQFEMSKDDETFAYFKRPTKLQKLQHEEVGE